jgi:hypothetical protein
MLAFLKSPEGVLFNEWIVDMLRREENKLHNGDERNEIYRAQGSTRILNIILDLEGELRQYQRDVDSGRVQKIEGATPHAVV